MARIAVSAPEELASLGSDAEELVRLCASLTALLEQEPADADEAEARQRALEAAADTAATVLEQASATAAYLRMRVKELR